MRQRKTRRMIIKKSCIRLAMRSCGVGIKEAKYDGEKLWNTRRMVVEMSCVRPAFSF